MADVHTINANGVDYAIEDQTARTDNETNAANIEQNAKDIAALQEEVSALNQSLSDLAKNARVGIGLSSIGLSGSPDHYSILSAMDSASVNLLVLQPQEFAGAYDANFNWGTVLVALSGGINYRNFFILISSREMVYGMYNSDNGTVAFRATGTSISV